MAGRRSQGTNGARTQNLLFEVRRSVVVTVCNCVRVCVAGESGQEVVVHLQAAVALRGQGTDSPLAQDFLFEVGSFTAWLSMGTDYCVVAKWN